VNSHTTSKIALATVFCVFSLLRDGSSVAQTSQSGRLSRQQAIQYAFAGLKTSGRTNENYKVDTARYQPDKHRWLVKFHEVGPKVPFDSNTLAFVDDSTGLVCVKQASAVGPCN